MAVIKSFRELEVYRLALKEAKRIFLITKDFPKEETMETQAWLDHAATCQYLDKSLYTELNDIWQQIGGKLNRMIQRADGFFKSAIK